MKFKTKKDATTSVLSLLLVLVLVLTSMSSIFLVMIPHMEDEKEKHRSVAVANGYDALDDVLDDLIPAGFGAQREEEVTVEKGSVNINPAGDRFVFSYSFDPNFDFNVSGLGMNEGKPDSFTINVKSGEVDKAIFYWLNDTCFLAGTRVLMKNRSYKNIEDVTVGDWVKSYDEEKGVLTNAKVTRVFHHPPESMGFYYLVINNYLKVTPNHRFYSTGKWVYANDLKIGDRLLCSKLNSSCFVSSIKKVFKQVPTFNLEIELYHSFFVSIEEGIDILVHNADTNSPPNIPSSPDPADTETDVDVDTFLSWTGGDPDGDTVYYDVYLCKEGDVASDPIVSDNTNTWCDPGGLSPSTTYNWYVVADDRINSPVTGPTWSFTTETAKNKPPVLTLFSLNSQYPMYYNETTYIFEAEASDGDDTYIDDIVFNFSWGDGTFDLYGPFDTSSDGNTIVTCSASHSWSQAGVYEVKVRVNDTYSPSAYSEWSEPLSILIVYKYIIPDDVVDSETCKRYVTEGKNPWHITTKKPLDKAVQIDLFSSNYPPSDAPENKGWIPRGRIWIFDLGSIVHTLATRYGEQKTIFENRGIIFSYSNDGGYIQECSNIFESEDTLVFRITQIRPATIPSGSGMGVYKLKLRINNNLVRETHPQGIYNFYLQISGENKELWYNYLKTWYKFKKHPTQDYLVYDLGNNKNLVFSSAVVTVNLESIR